MKFTETELSVERIFQVVNEHMYRCGTRVFLLKTDMDHLHAENVNLQNRSVGSEH